jgi:hypothetical protein
MVSINYAFKEIISKIVYYGPGLSGKTTNLQYVFSKVPKDTRGELISLATDADRTLYFDFLPVNVGTIRGFATKFQLYTVPGQVYYNATRKLVLRGVDGLVFVADSQKEKMDDNIESLKNLEENLAEYGYDINELPLVIQYNKRDLPNIATVDELQALLNPKNWPYFEAVATTGLGVFGTLKTISKMVLDKARQNSPEKPKRPAPVVVSMDSSNTSEESQPQLKVTSLEPEGPTASKAIEHYESTAPEPVAVGEPKSDISKHREKPSSVTGVETPTNVVVSSSPEETPPVAEETGKVELEENTEHSVLREESYVPDVEPPPIKKHPAVLDADKLSLLYGRQKDQDESEQTDSMSEDSSKMTEQYQASSILSKPHMAESVRVKPKKKSSLFGWLKRK